MNKSERTELAALLQAKSLARGRIELVQKDEPSLCERNQWAARLQAAELSRLGHAVYPYERIVTNEESPEADDA